eukprot:scaffold2069_cov254-Pinguiococcus_pyrenoidosus.AAC.7
MSAPRSRSSAIASTWPKYAAKCRAWWPLPVFASNTEAPQFSCKSRMTAAWPKYAATWTGSTPEAASASEAVVVPLCFSSSCTNASSPVLAAYTKAVCPRLSPVGMSEDEGWR